MTIKELKSKVKYNKKKHNICLIPVFKGNVEIPFTFEHRYDENCKVIKYEWNYSSAICFDSNLKYKGKDNRPTLNIYWAVEL